MDPEIASALITAIATIFTAAISSWVAIKIKDMELRIKNKIGEPVTQAKRQVAHWLWGVGGAVIGATLVLGILAPTGNLPLEWPTADSLYDDFNELTLDENFDQGRWEVSKYFGCDVRQRDGVAIFSANSPSPSNIVCVISADELQVPLEEVGSMEAGLYATSGAKGDYSIGIIEFSSGTFEEGTTTWIAQCGILQVPKENRVELFFNVHSTYPEGDSEYWESVPASVEHWYKMRLEIIPDTVELRCYADDGLIGSYHPTNADVLRKENFDRHLVGFWTTGSQATYYADDVRFSPSK
jgi:hypothetical protein